MSSHKLSMLPALLLFPLLELIKPQHTGNENTNVHSRDVTRVLLDPVCLAFFFFFLCVCVSVCFLGCKLIVDATDQLKRHMKTTHKLASTPFPSPLPDQFTLSPFPDIS